MLRVDDLIDYSGPTMRAETALKRLHHYALSKNYVEARVQAHMAMLAASDAYSALLAMEQKERQDGTN